MKSSNITVTDTRLAEALKNANATSLGVSPKVLSKNVSSNLQLVKCRVLRVYNTKQRVLVKILHNNKKVQAKILNPYLSRNVNISFTPDGVLHNDEDGYFIEPYDKLYGVIMEFKDKTSNSADYCFLGYIDSNTTDLNSNSTKAEIQITVDDNTVSITEERVNIKAENLFINGLPYNKPKLKNYYTKKEIDKIIHELNPDLNINDILNSGG